MSKKQKKSKAPTVVQPKVNPLKDKRFNWILASNDPEVNDGLLIDNEDGAREKFLREANPDNIDIVDYIDALETSLDAAKDVVGKLQEEVEHYIRLDENAQETLLEVRRLYEEKLKTLYKQQEVLIQENMRYKNTPWKRLVNYIKQSLPLTRVRKE